MAASSDQPEVMKATRSLDNSEVHSFFYFLLLKVILYPWMLYYVVDMSAGICWLTWLSCLLILTIISRKAWSTCWLDSRWPICVYIYTRLQKGWHFRNIYKYMYLLFFLLFRPKKQKIYIFLKCQRFWKRVYIYIFIQWCECYARCDWSLPMIY